MPSKAQGIRDKLITLLRTVSLLKSVTSDWEHWHDEMDLPSAVVIRDRSPAERGPTRSKEVTDHFRIVVTMITENGQDDFDTIEAAIENVVEAEPTLGGLALDAWRVDTDPFATAETVRGQVYVRQIFIDVFRRHTRAAA